MMEFFGPWLILWVFLFQSEETQSQWEKFTFPSLFYFIFQTDISTRLFASPLHVWWMAAWFLTPCKKSFPPTVSTWCFKEVYRCYFLFYFFHFYLFSHSSFSLKLWPRFNEYLSFTLTCKWMRVIFPHILGCQASMFWSCNFVLFFSSHHMEYDWNILKNLFPNLACISPRRFVYEKPGLLLNITVNE